VNPIAKLQLLVIDLSISAYDSSVELPSTSSHFVAVTPSASPWPIKIHLACQDASDSSTAKKHLPTIIYEPSSGIPGSLALLETPLVPSSVNATNPGRWLFDMQAKGHVGRVCVWDRPGYGFSEVLSSADLGMVADALYKVLDSQGEVKKAETGAGFMLVGEGYGG
jgi:pimeloyl-ACP methyl ester carboxylesterase